MKLQPLLAHCSVVFKVPKELPPTRSHDHKILLRDESHAIKLRPFRYPTIQKNEIERMILEIKEAGIIRDNTSSFASHVVLVKKKDGF